MIGYPIKLILKAVDESGGPEAVRDVLDRAGISPDRDYRMNALYDNEEAMRLYGAAAMLITVEDLARCFVSDSSKRFSKWYAMCRNSRELFELQPEIHNMFALGLERPEQRQAVRDKFRLDKHPDELVVHYRSSNRLCALYIAIANRVIEYYEDEAIVTETQCMHDGYDECEIHIRWS